MLISRMEILLVVVCLTLTGALYASSVESSRKLANGEFQRLADDGIQVLSTRMQTYEQSVQGIVAFIATADGVQHDAFAAYVDLLDIENRLSSISGLGRIVEVPDIELDDFVLRMREEGQADFQIRRVSDAETHFVLKYIAPKEPNKEALGLDLTFNMNRAAVMERARATGKPQMTAPLQLVQEDRSLPGFVLFTPVFDTNAADGEVGTFDGWISAAFVAHDLISGLTAGHGTSYEIKVFDGKPGSEEKLIFEDSSETTKVGTYTASREINQFGRTWTVSFRSTQTFDSSLYSYEAITIVIAGLTLTGLILMVLRNMQQRSRSLSELAKLRARQVEARQEENRSIIENEVTSVLLLDGAENIKLANQAAQECFGYAEEELKTMQFGAVASAAEKPVTDFNAIGQHKDGRKLELDLQRNDWINSAGETWTTVIIRDLTEQNSAERELKRTKKLYDLALHGAEIGVFDLDLTTGQSEVSETWCQIMGYGPDCNKLDSQGSFLARIHPEDKHILEKADEDCIEGRTERSIAEYRLRTLEGGWCWMRSDAVVVDRDNSGKALRMIGTQTDITALRHDRNALEASEKMFRQVLSNAPIGMALMDNDGNFIGVNDAFCELVGLDETHLLDYGRLADLIPYDERKALYASVSKMMKEGKAAVYTAEHQILHNDGGERWGLLNVSWSFNRNEGSNFFIAQIIDITEQKRLDLIKDEFVSTVSHELRTPLTSIKGALGLLMGAKDANLSKENVRLVEIAKSNAERLTDIVNDILDLEKISSGEITFDICDVELADVMQDAVQEMLPFAVTHDNTIRLDMPSVLPPVLADPRRTKQVLANLISNACKYSFPDTEVVVRAERIDDMAIVFVQNVGAGVPQEFRSRIFQAFSQADSSDTRAKGGTGLGLNITRQIVMRHGGQIGFESIIGGLTVFWFTVPLATVDVDEQRAIAESPTHEKSAKPTVLHVEDDPDFAEVISNALKEFAFVTHAKSIAAAHAALSTEHFDIVILDWSLPDGIADNLLEAIVAHQPGTRVIALTADAERKADTRLYSSHVKSRTDISTIVDSVSQCYQIAS